MEYGIEVELQLATSQIVLIKQFKSCLTNNHQKHQGFSISYGQK